MWYFFRERSEGEQQMKKQFDVYIEYVRDEVYTVNAETADEAQEIAYEIAEGYAREEETVKIAGYNLNFEK
jgi:ribosomal protein S2